MTEVPQAQSLLLSSEYLSLHQKNHNLFVCLAHLQRENKGPAPECNRQHTGVADKLTGQQDSCREAATLEE